MDTEPFAEPLQTLERLAADLQAAPPPTTDELSQKTARAVQAIRAAMHELRQTKQELQRREARLTQAEQRRHDFLTHLSHELRSPLAAISTASQVLDRIGEQIPRAVNLRTMIVRQTQHLSRMVEDLQDIARLARGKVRLRKGKVPLADVLGRAAEAVKPLLDEQGRRLEVCLPTQTVYLNADAGRLEHVLVRLLDYTAQYGAAAGPVRVSVEHRDDQAVVTIKHAGAGLGPELTPPLANVPPPSKRDGPAAGSGVGLALLRRLIELHGGRLTAHAEEPGPGGAFVVHLPVLPAVESSARVAPAFDRPTGPLHVLVVEDDRDSANSLAMLLRLKGCEVLVARNGPAALELARDDGPIDVVLLDIGLPGMDGYQVAATLRQQPRLRHTCFVAITGFGQDEDRLRSQEAGFQHHLVKPVDPQQLQDLLLSLTAAGTSAVS